VVGGFRALIGNASISVAAALPCLATTSDFCTLAQALSAQQHFLGIRHYETPLFWAGAVLISASMFRLAVPSQQGFFRTMTAQDRAGHFAHASAERRVVPTAQ
jgi:hypothetical protein